MATDDREKALDAALGQIEKQFGKGSIMRMGENLHMNIESIPTGALALDMALGIGGLPAVASSSSTARVLGKSTLRCTSSPKPSETVASVPTSTPSTRWTRLCARHRRQRR